MKTKSWIEIRCKNLHISTTIITEQRIAQYLKFISLDM